MDSRDRYAEFGFDDTYVDLAKALTPTTKGRNYVAFSDARQSLEHIVGGRLEYDADHKEWTFKSGKYKFDLSLTSEGIKKLSILDLLLGNHYLTNKSVIIIDEIGRELEAQAARTIAERGVQLIGTAHGQTISNLLMNPTLSDLIGGIESVTLSDEEAKRRGTQKVVLERKSPPTFDVLVEIRQRNQVVVYQDVAEAVDALVRGIELQPELRTKSPKGQIIREKAPAPVLEGAGFAGNQNQSGEGKKGKKPLSRSQANIVEISGKSKPVPGELRQNVPADQKKDPASHRETIRVYCYGVARNRLNEAAERLDVPVIVVNNLEEADMLMTLRPYYRERQQIIVEAEERGIPIYVLRSNTTTQIEYTLANMLKIEVQEQAVNWEDVEDETISAIRSVLSGEVGWIDLSPADHAIRRIQKEMINEAGLVCQSFGKEPRRRLRIYRN